CWAAELAGRSVAGPSVAPCPPPEGRSGRPSLVALPPTRVQPPGVRRARGRAVPPRRARARAAPARPARGPRPAPGRAERPGRRAHVARLSRRAAIAAIALVAAIIGLFTASVIGPSAADHPPSVPPSRTSAPDSSAIRNEGSIGPTHVNAKRGGPGH